MKLHIIIDEEDETKEKQNSSNLRLLTKDGKNVYDNIQNIFLLKDDDEEYKISTENENHRNDKIMRKVLKDKKQAAICLNKWLKIEEKYKIKAEDLEEVTESYITVNWENREADIVYKDKIYEGVFYHIEHQEKVNYEMVKRVEEYKNEIRNNYQRNRKIGNNKNLKIAKVITIVIYTGKERWNAGKTIEELEVNCPRLKTNEEGDYKLVSSKEYTVEELKEEIKEINEDVLAKIFLIDKLGEINSFNKMEKELEKVKITQEEIHYIASYINKIINKKYGKEIAKQMIKIVEDKLDEKEEVNDMLMEGFVDTCIEEGIRRGEERGRVIGEKIGKEKERQRVSKNLYKMGFSTEKIAQVLGDTIKQIEEYIKEIDEKK